tara:strand:- start:83 stop:346 length:264 start_codon:yes stop_codon:yes gene_type:complete
MNTRAILCDNQAEWDVVDATAREALSIPNAGATQYATPSEVINPDHTDFGKLVFPVKTAGNWKCDQLFDPADIINWDFSWFVLPDPE